MISLSVKITKKNLIPQLRRNLRPRMEKLINDRATQIASIARQLCPVSTELTRPGGPHGDLRDSIAVETYSGHRPGAGVAKRVVVGMFYGPFVEFGTSQSAAQPFLMPAYHAVKAHILADAQKIFKL